jgi:hypothetical protein
MNDPGPTPKDNSDAASILAAMHKVCNHDLPNKMVDIFLLLRQIEEREVDRLSNEGHDLVYRLNQVADTTATLVDFLKESVLLASYVPKPGRVDLRELLEELQIILSRTYLSGDPTWTAEVTAPTAVCDVQGVLRALTEMIKGLAGDQKISAIRWKAHADGGKGGVILQMEMRFAAPTANPWKKPRRDLLLARARLQRIGTLVAPLSFSAADLTGVRLRFPTEAS